MFRRLLIVVVVLLAVAGISQLVIPIVVEHEIEDRLTNGGGTAEASVSAVPAALLLFGNGERMTVTGTGLDISPEEENLDVFDRLDGFDRIDVDLTRSRVGPFDLARFELTRDGPTADYHLVTRGRTTAGDLAAFGADRLNLPGGPLAEFLADQIIGRPIPIDFNMGVDSDGGRIVVVSGTGTVAGIPTGPLAELITSFVVIQL